jgi:hypothetical protein
MTPFIPGVAGAQACHPVFLFVTLRQSLNLISWGKSTNAGNSLWDKQISGAKGPMPGEQAGVSGAA